MKPSPGQCCPTCGLVVPAIRAPRTGKHHPETSLWAAQKASKAQGWKHREILQFLRIHGANGMTDDEVDGRLQWGHATTTARMNELRSARLIGWLFDENGKPVRRKTRRGSWARVNVLAAYAKAGAA